MTPEELKVIREKAEAATPGPWEVTEAPGFGHDHAPYAVASERDEQIAECYDNTPGSWHPVQNEANAAFIAAANPQTVLRLLDEVERMSVPRSLSDWHEDIGNVLWWMLPVCEPPYCGTPLDDDWPYEDDERPVWTELLLPIDAALEAKP